MSPCARLSPISVNSTLGSKFIITMCRFRSDSQSTLNAYWITVSKAFSALLAVVWMIGHVQD
jgi:hypothetical protein